MSRGPVLHTALVLDDDHDRRAVMCGRLADHGVFSDQAATLEEAIRSLAARRYDLVVCDVVLCDPPGSANPAPRGYLAICYALAHQPASVVVQVSSQRRWVHPGAVLADWAGQEVEDLVYGAPGHREDHDSGCPWHRLREAEAATPAGRPEAALGLRRLPVMDELRSALDLDDALDRLEVMAEDGREWESALCHLRAALFPGSGDGA